MISAGLVSWQTERGFRLENDIVYGVYNGVGFAAACEDGGKLFTFMLSGPDQAFDAIEDLIVAQPGRLRELQVGDVENYLALFFEERGAEMPAQLMNEMLDFVVANARGCGFAVPRVCVKCGAPANKRSFYMDMVQPMCAACSEEERLRKRAAAPRPQPQPEPAPAPAPMHVQDSLVPQKSGYNPDEDDTYDQYGPAARMPQPNRAPAPAPMPARESAPSAVPLSFAQDTTDYGSLPKGILGTVLGALAGLVPLFISALLGLELTCLCAAVGFAAVFGYTLFNGLKQKSTALVVTAVVSEIFAVLGFIAINVIDGMGEGMAFKEALSESLFAEPIDYVNFVIGIVTAALGIFISLDILAKHISDTGNNGQQ